MINKEIEQKLNVLLEHEKRYEKDAYLFLLERLDSLLNRIYQTESEVRQVSGREILEEIRDYSLTHYGAMTTLLFSEWGVTCCEDFGEIVFNLIAFKILSKSKEDSRKDFTNIYNFFDVFTLPFLPKSSQNQPNKSNSNSKW